MIMMAERAESVCYGPGFDRNEAEKCDACCVLSRVVLLAQACMGMERTGEWRACENGRGEKIRPTFWQCWKLALAFAMATTKKATRGK